MNRVVEGFGLQVLGTVIVNDHHCWSSLDVCLCQESSGFRLLASSYHLE
jgi:hypothetical protein